MIAEFRQFVARQRQEAETRVLYDDASCIHEHLRSICEDVTDEHVVQLHNLFESVKHHFVSLNL